MTAIAWRAGVMAADTVGWVSGSHVKIPTRPKIRRSDKGLVACCGQTGEIEAFHEWHSRGGGKPTLDKDEGFVALWVDPYGCVQLSDFTLRWAPVVHGFLAIGAPDRFMMGVLFAGGSAEDAVRLAIEHTDGAGGSVQVERLHA